MSTLTSEKLPYGIPRLSGSQSPQWSWWEQYILTWVEFHDHQEKKQIPPWSQREWYILMQVNSFCALVSHQHQCAVIPCQPLPSRSVSDSLRFHYPFLSKQYLPASFLCQLFMEEVFNLSFISLWDRMSPSSPGWPLVHHLSAFPSHLPRLQVWAKTLWSYLKSSRIPRRLWLCKSISNSFHKFYFLQRLTFFGQ